MHLQAQRVCITPPPGCRVAVARVTLCGGGVDSKPGGGDEAREEVVKKPRE